MAAFQPATPVQSPGAIFDALRSCRNLREEFTVQVEMENGRLDVDVREAIVALQI